MVSFLLVSNYHPGLFHCDTILCGVWKPYIVFDYIIKTHLFNPTQYLTTNKVRETIRDKVWELHNKGWGYTKIHHYLVDNDYEVGKSRTVVKSMLNKRIKRERFLNQPIIENGYSDFRIEVFKDN